MVLYNPDESAIEEICRNLTPIWRDVDSFNFLISGPKASHVAASRLDDGRLGSVTIIRRFDNLGFAAGHNFLLELSFASGADVAVVLNPDVTIAPGAVQRLAEQALANNRLTGPPLRRCDHDGQVTNLTDSLGIFWTRNGRHFDIGQSKQWKLPTTESVVSGVTGACLAVSSETHSIIIQDAGYFFDPLFIAYREDAELGIRARRAGVMSVIVPVDGFGHIRSVRGSSRGNTLPDLLGVRNRFLLAWTLGPSRPGKFIPTVVRDLLVIIATLTIERTSMPGLREAFRVRRFARLKQAGSSGSPR